MSCTFEDAFMVNSFDESMDQEDDSTVRQKPVSTPDPIINQVNELKTIIKNEPEINAARVMYFKAEIEAGNYQVNSETIAQKMLGIVDLA